MLGRLTEAGSWFPGQHPSERVANLAPLVAIRVGGTQNTEGHPLTERLAALDAELAEHEANPEAEYEEALEAVSRGVPVFLARGSADGLLENHRREVAREKRHLRSTAAVLTPQGQELLTVDVKAVNNTEGIVNRTHGPWTSGHTSAIPSGEHSAQQNWGDAVVAVVTSTSLGRARVRES